LKGKTDRDHIIIFMIMMEMMMMMIWLEETTFVVLAVTLFQSADMGLSVYRYIVIIIIIVSRDPIWTHSNRSK
jgi:hypothetical protein